MDHERHLVLSLLTPSLSCSLIVDERFSWVFSGAKLAGLVHVAFEAQSIFIPFHGSRIQIGLTLLEVLFFSGPIVEFVCSDQVVHLSLENFRRLELLWIGPPLLGGAGDQIFQFLEPWVVGLVGFEVLIEVHDILGNWLLSSDFHPVEDRNRLVLGTENDVVAHEVLLV